MSLGSGDILLPALWNLVEYKNTNQWPLLKLYFDFLKSFFYTFWYETFQCTRTVYSWMPELHNWLIDWSIRGVNPKHWLIDELIAKLSKLKHSWDSRKHYFTGRPNILQRQLLLHCIIWYILFPYSILYVAIIFCKGPIFYSVFS